MNGFQIQVDLQALPGGVQLSQIQQNQVWWVEKRTTLYRLYLYAGVMDPTTRQIDSNALLPSPPITSLKSVTTSGLSSTSLTVSGNATISGNLTVASGATVSGNLTVGGTMNASALTGVVSPNATVSQVWTSARGSGPLVNVSGYNTYLVMVDIEYSSTTSGAGYTTSLQVYDVTAGGSAHNILNSTCHAAGTYGVQTTLVGVFQPSGFSGDSNHQYQVSISTPSGPTQSALLSVIGIN